MKKFDIVTIGSAVRDVAFYTDQTCVVDNPANDPVVKKLLCVEYGAKVRSDKVFFQFGGGGANTAINFSGLGLRTATLTGVGNDLDGQAIREQLTLHGVSTDLMQISKKQRTGFSFLAVDEQTGEHAAYVFYGAAKHLSITPAVLRKVQTNWFYISSVTMSNWKRQLMAVTTTKANISWNPGGKQLAAGYAGLKHILKHITILILNKDEATELVLSHPSCSSAGNVRQMAKTIQSWGPALVLITSGRAGSTAYDGSTFTTDKPPKDKPKDTTGAGDCYGSSFTAGMIRYKGNVTKAMKLATTNATHLVHTVGAQEGLLKWRDLPKNLQTL